MKLCEIRRDRKKGRGVYALNPIAKGELIERCQLLVLPESELGETLARFVFQYDRSRVAVPLGNGCLYNHSESPNVLAYYDRRKRHLLFVALRKILPGEELLIDYRYTAEEKRRYGIR